MIKIIEGIIVQIISTRLLCVFFIGFLNFKEWKFQTQLKINQKTNKPINTR
jgi:hypothetical protein